MPDDELWYPPVGFYFKVNVIGVSGKNEGSFQEVSGLNVKIGAQEVKEGGENRFVHRLPTPPKYENLVLKRGILKGSPLVTWVKQGLEQFSFTRKTVVINLMNEKGEPIVSWKFVNAYPVAMKISEFKAQENSIALETFELSFDYFTKVN
ncbi:MAG TPA: phage tail protein [Chitinophagaceae bacterium]|jgi:phage tail-like protein|nr:phage tail protein [Chitinophagaceae bacterium]